MIEQPFNEWIDLAQPRLGAKVISASDDFFAPKERLIKPEDPIFIPGKYDDHGKWMDGWESRRKRTPGHDWCIIKLGMTGFIKGVHIDTSHFIGNYPPSASLEACNAPDGPNTTTKWREILGTQNLKGDSHHYHSVECDKASTHVRLHIYPDGGIARLRVYGEVNFDWTTQDFSQQIDLLALKYGGRALSCNNEHFGSMHNLNIPVPAINMGDGWETRRRRTPGNDWVIMKLGRAGHIQQINVNTAFFKGNYPDRVSIEGTALNDTSLINTDQLNNAQWITILPESKLEADRVHRFSKHICEHSQLSHIRMNIFPDGGISRLQLMGMAKPD
ncbi:MAG: allantoicase [Pseudomonadales bacterium]|nr:allantoicase [Pseudomonadales bacterium]